MERLTYLNQHTEVTELTQFEDDYSWQELIEDADTVDQIFMHNAIDKLYEYEEAEEKGYIFRIPYKLGQTVYIIDFNYSELVIPILITKISYEIIQEEQKPVMIITGIEKRKNTETNIYEYGKQRFFIGEDDINKYLFEDGEEARKETERKLK